MGTCGSWLTLIPFDCATSAASRVEATEHLVTTGQRITFLKPTRWGDPSHSL